MQLQRRFMMLPIWPKSLRIKTRITPHPINPPLSIPLIPSQNHPTNAVKLPSNIHIQTFQESNT